jgi:tetratricopeptide (TPR) repeat protein
MNDHLLASVESRANEYVRSRNPRLLLEEQALADADALRRTALPSLSVTSLGRPPCVAAHILGWFHYLRFTALPDKDNLVDFAQALFLFDVNGSADHDLPPSLLPLLGAEPDPHAQIQLAHEFLEHGRASADVYALTVSINLFDRAQAAMPARHLDRASCLADLGFAYSARFDHTSMRTDLQASIDRAKQALAIVPKDHPLRPVPLLNLASAYLTRFEFVGDPADLDASIDHGEQAVAMIPADNRFRAMPLSALGTAYRNLFERTNMLAHIDASIDRWEQAVVTCLADHPECPIYLSNLARAYLVRFERTRILDDLLSSIERTENALAISRDRAHRALCLVDLTGTYARRFRHTQAPTDLETAIEYGKQALADRPTDAILLSTLGVVYENRFERTGEAADIQTAIEYDKRAIAVAQDPSRRALYLSNLALACQAHFRVCGELADLDASIEYGLEAVATSPNDDAGLPNILSNLAISYLRRFQRLGARADAQASIDHCERAVAATPTDHPARAACLSNLGAAYRTRYDHTGELADLHTGIDLAEQALTTTLDDNPALAGRLSNLAVGYQQLYKRTRELSDLRAAIEYEETALAVTPVDHPDRGMYLSNLAGAYRTRFESGWDQQPADLATAIEYGEQSVAATPVGHPRRGIDLSNLGAAYVARFEHSEVATDLVAAVDRCEQAMAITPPGHPDRAICLANLAIAYSLKSSAGHEGSHHELAARLAGYATGLGAAAPMSQAHAAREAGTALSRMGAADEAARVFRAAVHALRGVAPRELSRADQEHQLGGHPGLVSEAIAAHLDIGDAGGAVEVAELGRGILLSAALDTRTELTELDEIAPELATEFRSLRNALNAVDTDSSAVTDAARRRELVAQWDQLLDRIRRLPGLEHFLEPPRLADLQRVTTDGTVVVVNVAPSRSDAILLCADGITAIPLDGLTLNRVQAHTNELLDATRVSGWVGSLARQQTVPQILAWLWETMAAPVLDALGHQESPVDGQQWPRVWWVLTGATSLLPIHAAGLPNGPAVLDRVSSSYTPTIRALLHSRRRSSPRTRNQLTVAVQHTSGQPSLPGTVAEALALHTRHPTASLLTDDAATTTNVLTALTHSTWTHFACHATSDPAKPSRGGLVLQDATLALPQISGLRLDAAELVYLSACSTAQGRGRQADEAIHIASAFQLAGYRHVIATLWPIDDAVAAVAAHRFYELLPDSPSADLAPHALHRLAHELRGEHPGRPDLWAPFIHSGP